MTRLNKYLSEAGVCSRRGRPADPGRPCDGGREKSSPGDAGGAEPGGESRKKGDYG